MAQMSDKHIRHLPVLDKGKVVGVISIGDVVTSMLQDKETLIKGLENFILSNEIKL
jgi:CBS domain-containing protein